MKYTCPCCGYRTLPTEAGGTYYICPICAWEDDYEQLMQPNWSGPPNGVSLADAQQNFKRWGACDPKPHILKFIEDRQGDAMDADRDPEWQPERAS
jgi:hypothetical protein